MIQDDNFDHDLSPEAVASIIAQWYPLDFSGVHPAADLFPMPTKEEFQDLCKSIRHSGLRDPLIRHQETNQLIDGRSRLLACYVVGQDLLIEDNSYANESDVYNLSIIKNLHRRHLTPGQKAMIGDDLREVYDKEAKYRQGTRTDLNIQVNLPECSDNGQARDYAGEAVGVSGAYIDRARDLKQHAPDQAEAVRRGEKTLNEAYTEAKPDIQAAKREEREKSSGPPTMVDIIGTDGETWKYRLPKSKEQFNPQKSDRIDWAEWSWNPVVGCKHGCPFCYARAITASPGKSQAFPAGFEPAFYPHRLAAPVNTRCPNDPDRPDRNRVFVCSMADLFGKWVPDAWIRQVFDAAMEAPDWEYLFLTKWPRRYRLLSSLPKAWFGASVIQQADVKRVEKDMKSFDTNGVKWVSLEPMLEPIRFNDLSWCDMVAIGSQTATNQPEDAPVPGRIPDFSPKIKWVSDVIEQCEAAGVAVYLKENLRSGPGMEWPKQSPLTASIENAKH